MIPYTLFRGTMYWFRYASLSVGQEMLCLDLTTVLGQGVGSWMAMTLRAVATVAGAISALLAIAANVWLWRGARSEVARSADRDWLIRFIQISALCALVIFLTSPVTIMSWQVFSLFHLAVLPVVLWLGNLSRTRPVAVGRYSTAYAAFSLILLVAMSVASPHYRPGGMPLTLTSWHPALSLDLERSDMVRIDPVHGTPPDVLQEERWDRAGKPPHTVPGRFDDAPRSTPD